MLLVGSRALLEWTCGSGFRQPKDTDYICPHEEAKQYIASYQPDTVEPNVKGTTLILKKKGSQPVELMIAWPGSITEAIYKGCTINSLIGNPDYLQIAPLNVLYLLKMSHRYLKNSPHFLKTMEDIHYMRALGAEIDNPELLKAREKETYDYKHPSLMRNKKQFFDPNEGVKYQYDHDTIHLAMAVEPLKPAYTNFKHDQAEVMIDREKWNAQPESVKLNSVYEEAAVLALERSQIPFRGQVSPDRSYRLALQKVCTSISSGWWREYAWEHYREVIGIYEAREAEKPYLIRFDEALKAGIIRQFEGSNPMERFA